MLIAFSRWESVSGMKNELAAKLKIKYEQIRSKCKSYICKIHFFTKKSPRSMCKDFVYSEHEGMREL